MKPMNIAQYFDTLGQSQKAYGRLLEPVCKRWGLRRNEVDVLLFLFNNPDYNRAADIVARRGMTKSHVSLSVTSLVETGLLERRFSPEDRRTVHLHLTQSGQTIAREAWQAQQEFFNLLYAGIPEEELRQWEQITEKIRENILHLNINQTNP